MFQTVSVSQVCKFGHAVILEERCQRCFYKNHFFYFTVPEIIINKIVMNK